MDPGLMKGFNNPVMARSLKKLSTRWGQWSRANIPGPGWPQP
jgi:hypothetical protein